MLSSNPNIKSNLLKSRLYRVSYTQNKVNNNYINHYHQIHISYRLHIGSISDHKSIDICLYTIIVKDSIRSLYDHLMMETHMLGQYIYIDYSFFIICFIDKT